ncbi:hypothetical protein EDD18DRAFT_297866 [Armillaria luteobubalina]|uniref:Uncharacterized protein n=1 Tax=Armillaria luteobubalina TaxID=153913 RepID=A0AA39U406_9AGAR|nr:hypothetical protein EDD18DRAFT_297866 [Armillaria luteobubalina]
MDSFPFETRLSRAIFLSSRMATRAHKIGSLLFCPNCGTLLDLPKDGELHITTQSQPDAFPVGPAAEEEDADQAPRRRRSGHRRIREMPRLRPHGGLLKRTPAAQCRRRVHRLLHRAYPPPNFA